MPPLKFNACIVQWPNTFPQGFSFSVRQKRAGNRTKGNSAGETTSGFLTSLWFSGSTSCSAHTELNIRVECWARNPCVLVIPNHQCEWEGGLLEILPFDLIGLKTNIYILLIFFIFYLLQKSFLYGPGLEPTAKLILT